MVAASPERHDGGLQANPVEVQSYQPPWKVLSDFALQSDIDQPAFQQLVSVNSLQSWMAHCVYKNESWCSFLWNILVSLFNPLPPSSLPHLQGLDTNSPVIPLFYSKKRALYYLHLHILPLLTWLDSFLLLLGILGDGVQFTWKGTQVGKVAQCEGHGDIHRVGCIQLVSYLPLDTISRQTCQSKEA